MKNTPEIPQEIMKSPEKGLGKLKKSTEQHIFVVAEGLPKVSETLDSKKILAAINPVFKEELAKQGIDFSKLQNLYA